MQNVDVSGNFYSNDPDVHKRVGEFAAIRTHTPYTTSVISPKTHRLFTALDEPRCRSHLRKVYRVTLSIVRIFEMKNVEMKSVKTNFLKMKSLKACRRSCWDLTRVQRHNCDLRGKTTKSSCWLVAQTETGQISPRTLIGYQTHVAGERERTVDITQVFFTAMKHHRIRQPINAYSWQSPVHDGLHD